MNLTTIIKIIIIIIILIALVKKSIKLFIYLNLALVIFSVIFIQSGEEFKETFNLEDDNPLVGMIDDFSNKRDQYKIVDAEVVYDTIDDAIDESKHYIVKNGKLIIYDSIETIADQLSNDIVESGILDDLEAIDYKALNDIIKNKYSDLSDKDQEELTVKTMNKIKNKTP